MIEKFLIACVRLLYCFFKLLPTKNKVTMISRQSNSETTDFKLLKNKLNEIESNLEVKVLCKELVGGAKATLKEKIKYSMHLLRQMYHIATSKVVVLDSYCILVSILKHKKSLKVIQMWHSMGTMKKFGYQIIGKEEGSSNKIAGNMKMHKNYDYVFASGKSYAPYLEEGFKCGMDKIKIFSLPRVDLLTSQDYKQEIRKKIEEKYPIIKNKKNIVYCPTFRKNEKNFEKYLNEFIKSVDTSKYNLILKLHPLSKVGKNGNLTSNSKNSNVKKTKNKGNLNLQNEAIINDTEFSSMEMLFIADYVVSDYSCIVYESAILDIPTYFFAFDLEKYENARGLTFDYKKEVPGLVSGKINEILKAIDSESYDYERLRKFRKKYVENIEDCTAKIAEFILRLC